MMQALKWLWSVLLGISSIMGTPADAEYVRSDPINNTDPTGMVQEALNNPQLRYELFADLTPSEIEQIQAAERDGGMVLMAVGAAGLTGGSSLPIALRGSFAMGETLWAASSEELVSGPASAISGLNLQKQMASASQLSQLAEGAGTVISQPARQANRIADQIGGNPANIQKVSSSEFIANDGTHIQTHAFRDVETNQIIEPKTIINDNH